MEALRPRRAEGAARARSSLRLVDVDVLGVDHVPFFSLSAGRSGCRAARRPVSSLPATGTGARRRAHLLVQGLGQAVGRLVETAQRLVDRVLAAAFHRLADVLDPGPDVALILG